MRFKELNTDKMKLTEKKCVPCEGGVPPFDPSETEEYLKKVDNWNLEDFSIFSQDNRIPTADIHSGGRAIPGFCRPYPRFTAGKPTIWRYNLDTREIIYEFEADGNVDVPTEIFIPEYQYPRGYKVEVSSGYYERNMTRQVLYVFMSASGPQRVMIKPI